MPNEALRPATPPASAACSNPSAPGTRAVAFPTRESVTTIGADGSRPFLFPTHTRGRFTRARRLTAWALIALYLALPWIRINGYPAVFLDVADRRFHLFGVTFAAQDLWLLFFVITGVGFALFFLTALLGRVWCGWACPQTVFLDHVYRAIERWIDGDAVARRRLHNAPWSPRKIARRVVKHALFLLVSAVITHLLLAYFVSLPELWAMVRSAPAEHLGAFVFMVVATAVLHFNYAWFREQMCIVLCPYGRFQSALIDDHTLVIGYDARRGEPRGRSRRAESPASDLRPGDCVDCLKCVSACPAGIDIRQGLQMECTGCTACVDACDDVMSRLRRPTGLIRYDSQTGFNGGRTRWIRPRTLLYFALLLVGTGVATWAITTIKPATLGVTRMVGAPYIVDAANVRNQFLVRLVNKRNAPARFRLTLVNAPAGLQPVGFDAPVAIGPLGELVQPLVLQQPRTGYTGPFAITVRIEDDARSFELVRTVEFLGPEPRLLRERKEATHAPR